MGGTRCHPTPCCRARKKAHLARKKAHLEGLVSGALLAGPALPVGLGFSHLSLGLNLALRKGLHERPMQEHEAASVSPCGSQGSGGMNTQRLLSG